MDKSSLLVEGIFIGIWFTIFVILSIKAVNKIDKEAKRFEIHNSDLEWWESVRSCFKYNYK